jgi:Flp pilus assembly protein TadD
METANLFTLLSVIILVAGIGIGSMIWAYAGAGSRAVLFQDPIAAHSIAESEAFQPFQQGCIAFKAGKYQRAIDHFTQAIQLKPDFAEAYHDRGLAFANLRRDDDATINLVKASELYLERNDALELAEANRASVAIIKQNLEALKARKQARETKNA